MTPKVTVILPTLNRAKLLPRAIDSVLSQSFKDFELLILNDGSTDNTEEVIKEYMKKDSRIRYIKLEKPSGIPIIRNRGMSEARGEYMAWQDDDDEWLPGKLEVQVKKMDELGPEYGVVYSAFLRHRPDGKEVFFPPKWASPLEGNIYSTFLKKNFLCLQAMLIRKSVFDDLGGFDLRYPALQEYDWFPKIAKKYKFAYIPTPYSKLYLTASSNSQQYPWAAEARELFVADNTSEIKEKGLLGYHYGVIGDLWFTAKKPWRASRFFLKAGLADPLYIKHWIKCLIALVGLHPQVFKGGKQVAE
ncbi:MAG: glycosyltransferase family 2 protein [bacterium]|nr:glycosyltransferase family 2 protein [bacterium]